MNEILLKYLKKQNVSIELATEKEISFDENKRIVIPVKDISGTKILFNKYRRNPEDPSKDTPKYTYDAGAKAALYNVQTIHKGQQVIITEGEFKALCLESLGFVAVSSTGGAGTFKEEWIELLKDKEIFILFDTDDAGIKGAYALNQKIPSAKIIFLPEGDWGKDINEYVGSFTHTNEINSVQQRVLESLGSMMVKAQSWHINLPESYKLKGDLLDKIKELKLISSDCTNKIYESKDLSGKNHCRHLEIYNDILWTHINNLNKTSIFFKKHKQENTYKDDFFRAKNVPIHYFIKFNSQGYARSVWNQNDKNPSMKYYPDKNKVWDYSTGRGGDSVDVAMALWGLKFKAALDKLNSL